ncbi:MAG TPA: NAD-dependent epimerase/dehydratase family protein, partial [Candidatus Paceibacterota bacterium]|nr:NAD-dependent epimerase/dehydratase family protein [Candidatus Paceibacterota bacterium]
MERLIHRSRIDAPAQAVFEWHRRRGAFERLIPPWEAIRVDQSPILLAQGARAVLRVRIGPVWVRWLSRITEVEEGRGFADAQERGPFAAWEHAHRFLADGPRACWIEDDIRYRLPGGAAGSRLGGALARRRLERWMRYRHDVLAHDAPLALPATAGQPLRILLTGATGMVGRNLSCFLGALGHQVWPLRRDPSRRSAAPPAWDPDGGWIDLSGLPPLDAVVHLAGENISGRWTATRKERIRRSRIEGTRLLCGAIARLPERPRAMVMASGLGFYGDRGDQPMSESSGPGRGFLAELARDW